MRDQILHRLQRARQKVVRNMSTTSAESLPRDSQRSSFKISALVGWVLSLFVSGFYLLCIFFFFQLFFSLS